MQTGRPKYTKDGCQGSEEWQVDNVHKLEPGIAPAGRLKCSEQEQEEQEEQKEDRAIPELALKKRNGVKMVNN